MKLKDILQEESTTAGSFTGTTTGGLARRDQGYRPNLKNLRRRPQYRRIVFDNNGNITTKEDDE